MIRPRWLSMIERHRLRPMPSAFGLGREEGLVQARDHFVLQAGAHVGDAELDHAAFFGRVARHDAQLDVAPRRRQPRVVDRLGRVLQQVEQHLLDQDRVDHQRRQALRHVGVDRDVAPAQFDAGQVDRVVDDVLRACAGWRCGSLRFTKARMRWMICPARSAWRDGLLQRGDQVVLVDRVALDARHHAVAVVGDRGQRLVQFVRHRRRHLAHRHQAARHLRLLGLARGQRFGVAARGDVGGDQHLRQPPVGPLQVARAHVEPLLQRDRRRPRANRSRPR